MPAETLIGRAREAFSADLAAEPPTSLRSGNAQDRYCLPVPFSAALDAVSDAYLEENHWGVAHLDPASWRHYLPCLMDYAVRHVGEANNVTDALIASLRPPDREPPRLASLSVAQEALVRSFLEYLAFTPDSGSQDYACQVLDEWWLPGALYR